MGLLGQRGSRRVSTNSPRRSEEHSSGLRDGRHGSLGSGNPDALAEVHPIRPHLSVTPDRQVCTSPFPEVTECVGVVCQNYSRGREVMAAPSILPGERCYQPSLATWWERPPSSQPRGL